MNDTNNNTENPQVKVGSIFCMSWGYDQTNVNFFQVTRTSPKGIFIREIGYRPAGNEGFMCQDVVPTPNAFLATSQWCGRGYGDTNPETFRRLNLGKTPSFSIRGRYYAFLTNKTEQHYNSWYA